MINLIYAVHSISVKGSGVSFAVRDLYNTISRSDSFSSEIVTTEKDEKVFFQNDSKVHTFPSYGYWWYSPKFFNFLKKTDFGFLSDYCSIPFTICVLI